MKIDTRKQSDLLYRAQEVRQRALSVRDRLLVDGQRDELGCDERKGVYCFRGPIGEDQFELVNAHIRDGQIDELAAYGSKQGDCVKMKLRQCTLRGWRALAARLLGRLRPQEIYLVFKSSGEVERFVFHGDGTLEYLSKGGTASPPLELPPAYEPTPVLSRFTA